MHAKCDVFLRHAFVWSFTTFWPNLRTAPILEGNVIAALSVEVNVFCLPKYKLILVAGNYVHACVDAQLLCSHA